MTTKKQPTKDEALEALVYKQAHLLKNLDEYIGSMSQILMKMLKANELIQKRHADYITELKGLQKTDEPTSETADNGSSE